jgi:type IV fimbrial biogenesis protein FimT
MKTITTMNELNRTQGFTILELLVTMAILGILAAVAVPSLTDTMGRMSVNGATRTLATSLSLARSEAVKRGQDVSICPTTDGADCATGSWAGGWIIFVDVNNDADGDTGSIDVGDVVIRVYEPLSDLAVTVTPNSDLIAYDNKGFGKNAALLTFKVCPQDGNADNAREVEISLSGRARIIDTVGSCS